MMAITTNSSKSVKAQRGRRIAQNPFSFEANKSVERRGVSPTCPSFQDTSFSHLDARQEHFRQLNGPNGSEVINAITGSRSQAVERDSG